LCAAGWGVGVGCGIAAIPSLPVNDADALMNSGYLPYIRRQRVTSAIEEEEDEAAEKQHAPFESFPRATRALHDGDGGTKPDLATSARQRPLCVAMQRSHCWSPTALLDKRHEVTTFSRRHGGDQADGWKGGSAWAGSRGCFAYRARAAQRGPDTSIGRARRQPIGMLSHPSQPGTAGTVDGLTDGDSR
jgi:hypothetical protein